MTDDYDSRIKQLERLHEPEIGFYKTTCDHIYVSNRRRTRSCHCVIDFCLYRFGSAYPSVIYGAIFYTYNDIDIRWFKRSANVWGA